jgi:hypothetical protein
MVKWLKMVCTQTFTKEKAHCRWIWGEDAQTWFTRRTNSAGFQGQREDREEKEVNNEQDCVA